MRRIRNIVGFVFLAAAFLTVQEHLLADWYCSWQDENHHLYGCDFLAEPFTCDQWWGAVQGGQVCGGGYYVSSNCYESTPGYSNGYLNCYYF
jgi:hypothetical protein